MFHIRALLNRVSKLIGHDAPMTSNGTTGTIKAMMMHPTLRMALLATVTVAGFTPTAMAGSSNSYATPQQDTSITTFTAAAPPVMETYTAPAPVYAEPFVAEPIKDGFYDSSRYGGNKEIGYEQSHACGGVLDGEKCLVILSNHMRRVRLDRPAGTILVGNPLIADVTVLGNDTMFVSARTIGSTNIIVLDKQGNEIVTYEAFVREPRTKRVVLNNGGITESYQCAPYCERTLVQSDSPQPFQSRSGVISSDLSLDAQAISLQNGPNPNTDPNALGGLQQQQTNPGAIAVPVGGPAGSAANSGVLPAPGAAAAGGDLGASIEALAAPAQNAANLIGAITGLAGLGGGANIAADNIGPARTDAPPLPGSFN